MCCLGGSFTHQGLYIYMYEKFHSSCSACCLTPLARDVRPWELFVYLSDETSWLLYALPRGSMTEDGIVGFGINISSWLLHSLGGWHTFNRLDDMT